MNAEPGPECEELTKDSAEIVNRLEGLAGRRGTARSRAPRGRDLLLQLADQAPATSSEDATRLLHGVLSAVKRGAISETFAARLLDKMLPKAVAARIRPTVTLDLPAVTDAASFAQAQGEVLRAVAAGELAAADAKVVSDVLARTWEAVRVEQRHRRMATRPL